MYCFIFINRLQYVFQGRNPIPLLSIQSGVRLIVPWVPEVFFRVRQGASFRRPQADTCPAEGRKHERRSREKKPLAQSALISKCVAKILKCVVKILKSVVKISEFVANLKYVSKNLECVSRNLECVVHNLKYVLNNSKYVVR